MRCRITSHGVRRRGWCRLLSPLAGAVLTMALLLAIATAGLAAPPEPEVDPGLTFIPPPGLYLEPAAITVNAGDTFDLQLMASCGYNGDAAAANLSFDPQRLEVVSVTPDTTHFDTQLPANGFDNVAGRVVYDAGSLTCHGDGDCPSGRIRLATITLRAKTGAGVTPVDVAGMVTWEGNAIADGPGTGSIVTIVPVYAYKVYLPLVLR